MDIRELLNHIRAGSSDRQIARDVKIDRRTVKRHRE
jgi:FixJ family two-component response regulator